MMLTDGIVAIPDDACSPYPWPPPATARTIAELCCEQGLGDRLAWWALLDDTTVEVQDGKRTRLELATVLAVHRLSYGNGRTRRRRR